MICAETGAAKQQNENIRPNINFFIKPLEEFALSRFFKSKTGGIWNLSQTPPVSIISGLRRRQKLTSPFFANL